MKHLFALSCAVLVLASCASLINTPEFTATVTSPSQDDLVSVTVPSLETVNRLTTGLRVVGLDVQVKNNSDKPLTIKWADSSIEYNGKSHMVFLTDQYYSDAGKPMQDTHVSQGRKTISAIVPADNVPSAKDYAQNGTSIDPIYSNDITCHLSIRLGDEARVYVIRVVVGGQPQGPGVTPSLP